MFAYVHDEKVQPAPVVGEILLEAVSNPLEEHLQHKDVGEDLVSILQHHLHNLSLLNVDVFKGLQPEGEHHITQQYYKQFTFIAPSSLSYGEIVIFIVKVY